jgi:hypothetical protein
MKGKALQNLEEMQVEGGGEKMKRIIGEKRRGI